MITYSNLNNDYNYFSVALKSITGRKSSIILVGSITGTELSELLDECFFYP